MSGRFPNWNRAQLIGYIEDLEKKHESEASQQADRIAELEDERDSLRQTNQRLNRRAQKAEAAANSAAEAIEKAEGEGEFRWAGGNLGRALLAYRCKTLRERNAELEAALEASPKIASGAEA